MIKYGHNQWCLTLDADEILIYPNWTTRPLPALIDWLEERNQLSFGAMMLDLYPKTKLSAAPYTRAQDPSLSLEYFDSGNYIIQKKPWLNSLWMQAGVRSRVFFKDAPEKSPTLNKIPLVKWNRRFAYLNSTHSMLPPLYNQHYAKDGGEMISGVLLHSKFLSNIIAKSAEEQIRKEHFNNSSLYDEYYSAILTDPILWDKTLVKFHNWRQLERMGLMSRGGWC